MQFHNYLGFPYMQMVGKLLGWQDSKWALKPAVVSWEKKVVGYTEKSNYTVSVTQCMLAL